MKKFQVKGFGVLYYDLLFKSTEKGVVHLGGRAGGSVANFLSNCALNGGDASFYGLAGEDLFGSQARRDLADSGVKCETHLLEPRKKTRIIFETLGKPSELQFGLDEHSFGVTCPSCGQAEEAGVMKTLPSSFFERNSDLEGGVYYFDSASLARARFLDSGRKTKEIFAVADLGRIGALRYMKDSEMLGVLNRFDSIFCSAVVGRSLLKRTNSDSYQVLLDVLDLALLVVSDGANGVQAYFKSPKANIESLELSAPTCKVVDAAGAGDAFLAGMISRLALAGEGFISRKLFDSRTVADALDAGRSLASAAIQTLGARGHLEGDPQENLRKYSLIPDHCEKLVSAIQESHKNAECCPFCLRTSFKSLSNSPKKKLRGMKTYLRNVNNLLARMDDVGRYAPSKISLEDIVDPNSSTIVIGTGGSYPVANFLADLLSSKYSGFACAIHPMQFVRVPRRSDIVIIVTYSGGTADCEAALKVAIEQKVRRIILLTGNPNARLASILRLSDQVIVCDHSPLEKGFVSIRGTVLPCSWFLRKILSDGSYSDLLRWLNDCCVINPSQIFTEIRDWVVSRRRNNECLSFDLYGTGYAITALGDFESKITEGGVGFARIHESKDFSHGRFMSVMGGIGKMDSIGIVFCVGPLHGYEKELVDSLNGYQRVMVVTSKYAGLIGALELLVIVQFLIRAIGDCIQKDLSRPDEIPDAGLDLYRWKGSLR